MRAIERTSQFKRDYKRELKGQYKAVLQEPDGELFAILEALARDVSLLTSAATMSSAANGRTSGTAMSVRTWC